jgi:DNA/RNA endonuclease YhcR with UshA esterase domain
MLVRGRVAPYKGKSEIILEDPSQLSPADK